MDLTRVPELREWGPENGHLRVGAGMTAEVVVTGEYEIGMQHQAFLGPESGLAVSDGSVGVDLYISTQ